MTLLVDAALRGAVVVLLALIATALLRRRSAAFRHAILATALLTAAAMPALQTIAPGWHVPRFSRALEEPPSSPVVMTISTSVELLPTGDPVAGPPRIPLAALVVGIWVLGAALSLALLVAGLLRLAWLSSRAVRVDERRWVDAVARLARSCGLKRRIVLVRSPHRALLLTWGMVRPEIFLPDDRRHVVLAHELAHIRRSDWIVQVAAEVIRSLYWFNPLVWIACRRLRQESEHACDDAVLRGGVDGAEYAAHLLEVARSLYRRRNLWGLAPAMAQPSTLERRIRTMLDAQRIRTRVTRTTAALIVLVVLLAAIPIAGFGRTADAPAAQAAVAATPVTDAAQAQPAVPATPQFPAAPVNAQPVPPVAPAVAPAVAVPPGQSPQALRAPRAAAPVPPAVTPNAPSPVRQAAPASPVAPAAVPAPGAVRPAVAASAVPLTAVPAAPASAQTSAARTGDSSLAGAIADQFGGLIPGVSVTLTDVNTGAVRNATTDDTGQYRLGDLADGNYVLRAGLPGFMTASADVAVRRSSDERRNLMLRIGAVQERITITGSASAVVAVSEPARLTVDVPPVVANARRIEMIGNATGLRVAARTAQPLRIGGNILAPVKIKDVKPIYPGSLQVNGIRGTVVAVGTIGVDGTVQNLNAASAHPELVDATLTAVRQWQFRPTQLNGTPVETTMIVTAEFTID
jgi:beta-lactamase regulating signal transducer with metallopeptidase domain